MEGEEIKTENGKGWSKREKMDMKTLVEAECRNKEQEGHKHYCRKGVKNKPIQSRRGMND